MPIEIFTRRGSELVPRLGNGSRVAFNGTPVTPGYDIIVPIIQSNARGAATDFSSSTTDAYPANVDMWRWSDSTIQPASEPVPNLDSFNGMGIANTFVKEYIAAGRLASGRKVLVVNTAHGGTGFSTPGSNTKGTGYHWDQALADDQFNLARRTIDSLRTVLAAAGSGSRIVAFLANHGSTDGTNNMPKATFKAKLQDWISWMRIELNVDTVPYMMMQMRPDLVANETRHAIIDAAQAETANEMSRVGYALSPNGSEFFKADVVHFNAAGVREIGRRLHTAYSSVVSVTPPVVESPSLDELWRIQSGQSIHDGRPANVPIVNAADFAGGSDDLSTVLFAIENTAGQPACYVQLEGIDYKLNAIRVATTNDWRGFTNSNRRVMGLIGAPFKANGEPSTSVTVQPGFVNAGAGARDYALSPPTTGNSLGFAPVPITALYFSNTSTSVPVFISGIDFRGTLQTPYGVYSTAVQTKFARNQGASSPLPWQGISIWRTVPGSYVQHCRFRGFGFALNQAPPFEKGMIDTNYGNEVVRRCELDGRIPVELDPLQPRSSGGFMWNKPITSRFEYCSLHHTRLSGWAQNTNTNDQNERCTGVRIRTHHIADPTGDSFASSNGGFAASNVEEMVGIFRYEDVDLTSELRDHIYLALPGQYNNGSGTLVLPERPIVEVQGFKTSATAYGGCLVAGVSKQPNNTGISPAWQRIQDRGLANAGLFDIRRLDGAGLTPVRSTLWTPSMTPDTHYVVKYDN